MLRRNGAVLSKKTCLAGIFLTVFACGNAGNSDVSVNGKRIKLVNQL